MNFVLITKSIRGEMREVAHINSEHNSEQYVYKSYADAVGTIGVEIRSSPSELAVDVFLCNKFGNNLEEEQLDDWYMSVPALGEVMLNRVPVLTIGGATHLRYVLVNKDINTIKIIDRLEKDMEEARMVLNAKRLANPLTTFYTFKDSDTLIANMEYYLSSPSDDKENTTIEEFLTQLEKYTYFFDDRVGKSMRIVDLYIDTIHLYDIFKVNYSIEEVKEAHEGHTQDSINPKDIDILKSILFKSASIYTLKKTLYKIGFTPSI